jgi:hypothetical protein
MKERDHLEGLVIDGRIILKWIFKKSVGKIWTGLIWLRIRTVAGACESGNEPSGSIKIWEVFSYLRSYWWTKKGQARMYNFAY